MRRYLKETAGFTLILITFALIMNLLLSRFPLEPVHYGLQFQELNHPTVKANAIIIGTSHAVHAIRPSILNNEELVFYNFALNGASSTYYLKWYQELFSVNYPKPQYCILAVDWFLFDPDKLWRNFEQDSEHFPRKIFKELYNKPKEFHRGALINNRFPLLKYRNQMLRVFKPQRFNREEYDHGFIPVHLDFSQRRFQIKQDPVTVTISDAEKINFQQLVELLLKAGTKVIFTMIPEYGIERSLYQSSEAIKVIEATAEQHNIPFINYNTDHRNELINGEIQNFSDWGHMSPTGSTLFSNILADDLVKTMVP